MTYILVSAKYVRDLIRDVTMVGLVFTIKRLTLANLVILIEFLLLSTRVVANSLKNADKFSK